MTLALSLTHTDTHTHTKSKYTARKLTALLHQDHPNFGASLVAQTVKNLPATQETQVHSLGWEDPLGEGTATHSSILDWRIPQTEEPGGPQSMGLQRLGHN